MKKLLLITFLLLFNVVFSQQKKHNQKLSPVTLTSIKASPNPFNSQTVINFKSTNQQFIEFTVKSLLGKTVYFEKITAKIGLNFILFIRNDIPKGMYIYTLQSENEVVSKRLIIK
jgi:hypothetical protein